MKANYKQRMHHITCFVFDVDGVLTDGTVMVMPNELIRTMHIRDGYALQKAVEKGYHVVVISGGKSKSVRARLRKLGVKDIFLGADDKKSALEKIVKKYKLEKKNILYMGDDLPDYEVLQLCGLPACPRDAMPDIRSLCIFISSLDGGKGCVREVIEQTMRLQGKWPKGDQ